MSKEQKPVSEQSQFEDLSDRETIAVGRVGRSWVVKCIYWVSTDRKVDASITVYDCKEIEQAIIHVRKAVTELANKQHARV